MGEGEIINKRKENLVRWIKNPYNLTFLGIIIFAIIIRLFYFFLTKDQPLWWDEAEYMNMARAWAFNLDYEFLSVRPILLSLITAGFFKIAYSEFLPRFFVLIFSVLSVFGVYYLGKELYNKKIGLLSSFLMSIFYLNIFYSLRLMTEIPSLACFVFAGFFFWKYFKTNSSVSFYYGSAITAIGTLFRINTIMILFVVLIYVLITDKLSFVRKKVYWIGAGIFSLILSPYLIWGYIKFKGFVITQASAWSPPEGNYLVNGVTLLKNYLLLFPTYLSLILVLLLIIGLFLFYSFFLGLDILFKEKNSVLRRDLFILLLLIIPLIITSFLMSHNEDRYILNAFPAIFIIISLAIVKIFNLIKKGNKFFAILFLILLLGLAMYTQLQDADNLIKLKKDSYLEAKESGIWMKENSLNSDIILTNSWPMTMYYSEREILSFPQSSEDMDSLRMNNTYLKYFMLSNFQQSPDWTYSYPSERNLSVAQAYFADSAKTQPVVIIYHLR